jgi:tRNA(Arg) A34 adenosine deaminase TadA
MREAIALATEHVLAGDGGPFGAVVVKDGQVIARGWNQVTSANDPTAHAEVTAIRAAGQALGTFSLAGCVLYTSCEPCPMCLAACYWAGLDRVYYAGTRYQAADAGFSDEELYEELPKPMAERKLPLEQVLAAESAGPFDAWKGKDDRIPY